MSDLAPNLSGNKAVDQPRSMYLVELAMDLAARVLRPGGDFVCKLFQGEEMPEFVARLKPRFNFVKVIKPQSSRKESREVFVLGMEYRK